MRRRETKEVERGEEGKQRNEQNLKGERKRSALITYCIDVTEALGYSRKGNQESWIEKGREREGEGRNEREGEGGTKVHKYDFTVSLRTAEVEWRVGICLSVSYPSAIPLLYLFYIVSSILLRRSLRGIRNEQCCPFFASYISFTHRLIRSQVYLFRSPVSDCTMCLSSSC